MLIDIKDDRDMNGLRYDDPERMYWVAMCKATSAIDFLLFCNDPPAYLKPMSDALMELVEKYGKDMANPSIEGELAEILKMGRTA